MTSTLDMLDLRSNLKFSIYHNNLFIFSLYLCSQHSLASIVSAIVSPQKSIFTWNLWMGPYLKIVFEDVIKLRWNHIRFGWILNLTTGILIRIGRIGITEI